MWNLKEYLAREHGVVNAVQLQAHIEGTVGIIVTPQTLRKLLRSPAAPRREMIQLLCDVFNCRSDAFYLVTPNSERAKQWEKNRLEGKKPSALYETTRVIEEDVAVHPNIEPAERPKCLRATFTDPRLFYKRRLSERTTELATSET
jgi:hypothetical protein